MSKEKTLQKLGKAIREYRGVYYPSTGKWKTPPKPKAVQRICKHLEDLGLDFDNHIEAIDGFANKMEMRRWFLDLRAKLTQQQEKTTCRK